MVRIPFEIAGQERKHLREAVRRREATSLLLGAKDATPTHLGPDVRGVNPEGQGEGSQRLCQLGDQLKREKEPEGAVTREHLSLSGA
jgi:hypothetical protein